jgi:hypothetical protein
MLRALVGELGLDDVVMQLFIPTGMLESFGRCPKRRCTSKRVSIACSLELAIGLRAKP